MSRTGTTSLNDALQILGYPSVHFPMSHTAFSVAATDTSMAFGYAYIDLMYPGSKFILTVRRRIEEWLDSCEWLWSNRVLKETNLCVRDFTRSFTARFTEEISSVGAFVKHISGA